jgi:hypothetical protein
MKDKVRTRRYSIPDADDATILSIFDKASHYAADKRTVRIMIEHRSVPSVQTLQGLQRRHPEVDWRTSRLINSVSAEYGQMQLQFERHTADSPCELCLTAADDGQVSDMTRFIATQAALLRLRPGPSTSIFSGREERRLHTIRMARAGRLRLRIEANDKKTFIGALRKFLPEPRTYVPMRAVAGRLRPVPSSVAVAGSTLRFLERRYVSIAAALVTLLVGVQAVSLLHP